jgi:hypothetical protein
MIALTRFLPLKSSRTRTHAISVPVTTLISATIALMPTVIASAARAAGALMASISSPRPPSSDFAKTAASGSRTIRLNHSEAMPSPSGPTPPRLLRARARFLGSASAAT